jgi:serine/threonine protein kinase
MTPERWQQIEQIYYKALKLNPVQREAFLDQFCAGDESLRKEIDVLLKGREEADDFIKSPAIEVLAHKIAAESPPVEKSHDSIGKQMSHYRIIEKIGEGGMGEVYQAKDQKLGRDVAIKVLPEEFAKDADRVARFQREAKLLASLNHPNIAAIYGLEESDGTHFLVLELIEGDTLADRLKRGAIPVAESLKLALQIAEALEAAHEKGVIHRDLKPANIKVTPDGKAKVLDFGLAKAFAGERGEMILSDSPTLSITATEKGVILGTAAYMSPEQARGEAADKRADLWAFGVVLFEMLTGHATFEGRSVSDVLASVLKSEPEWKRLPPDLHPRIRLLLKRCLEKQVKNRYGSISDARVDIQDVLADSSGVLVQPATAAKDSGKLRIGLPWVAAVFILGLILAALAVWQLKPTPPPEPRRVVRFEYELPEGRQFNTTIIGPIEYAIAVSPDGTKLAYSTNEGLYLRSLDSLDARLIAGADKDTLRPFFSPDGQSIGYFNKSDMKWKMVSINGGTPSILVNTGSSAGITPSWDSEDAFVYTDLEKGIMRVSAKGGTPELLVKGSAADVKEGLPFSPQMLPDGKSVLFTTPWGEIANRQIVVQSLESGERRELFNGTDARYLPTGHIVYVLPNNHTNNLYARPFDLERLAVTGDGIVMLEGLQTYAVSDSGTLVYIPQPAVAAGAASAAVSGNTLVWVDRQGNEEPLGFAPHEYQSLNISPDGTQVATCYSTGGFKDIYILDLSREIPRLLTFDKADDSNPIWTPDGQRIVFHSLRGGGTGGIYSKAADGTGKVDLLCSVPNRFSAPVSWSKDGRALVMLDYEYEFPINSDIWMLSIKANRERKPLLQEKYAEFQPKISPDGRWMAYTSDESGKNEIYVRPFPDVDSGGRWKVSSGGGSSPLWSPDGRELFYRNGDATMAVEVVTEPTLKHGNPKTLFRGTYDSPVFQNNPYAIWDIHPNGKKFLMLKPPATTKAKSIKQEGASIPQQKIIVVLNWFEELKQRVPIK